MATTTIKALLAVAREVDQAAVQASAESAGHAAAADPATSTTDPAGPAMAPRGY